MVAVLVAKIEVTMPAGVTLAEMAAALQSQLCGLLVPPACEVTADETSSSRRRLSASSASFDTRKELDTSSTELIAPPHPMLFRSAITDPGAVA